MIFTDLKFWWFFAVVFALVLVNYKVLRSVRLQNILLLVSSYYFYAQWDWRFLSLIIISTLIDFVAGWQMSERPKSQRKPWLLLSLCGNLGMLGFFKYFDFFTGEAVSALQSLGLHASLPVLNIILPVGISFYTFQTMTYTLDIYHGHLKPTKDPIMFAAYVAFFPQLVAGPIERAANLLPQFKNLWRFNEEQFTQGLRLILFGIVLKVIVADNLAPIVDEIFGQPDNYNGGVLALGSVYFAFQIYGDFCGYSTIAIGLAKLLGFELMTNFRTPYFATSIQEFWRRWHISLSSFFRDYVYIPLGGSRTTPRKRNRNLLITFTVSGLWHGANWTFIFWGVYHGLLLVIQNVIWKPNLGALPKWLVNLICGLFTFGLVCVGWVLFRAQSIGDAIHYLVRTVTEFGIPDTRRSGVLFVLAALAIDYMWRKDTRLESVEFLGLRANPAAVFRWCTYVVMFWAVIIGMANRSGIQQFIYFQF